MKTAFKRLVNLVPRRGRVVAFDGSENVSECVARAFCAVERYGFHADSHWRMTEMRHEGGIGSYCARASRLRSWRCRWPANTTR